MEGVNFQMFYRLSVGRRSLFVHRQMSFFSNSELVQHLKREKIVKTERVEKVLLDCDRTKYRGEYFDSPQTIGYNQTISAPHMHAMCLEILSPLVQEGSKVMDVGSGSGYLTACLARLAGESGKVVGLETVPQLVNDSKENINRDCPEFLTSGRVLIKHANGWLGCPEEAPFDAIHVGAAAASVPTALVEQLREGGTLVIPVGPNGGEQNLVRIDKEMGGNVRTTTICGVRYVPLVNQLKTT
mmetsp:Transcript_5438/g.6606  ORF Transcript_5438/g.6606 Transcript_5438/m.6606 type:complete len:242 (-) Transcript_5438:1818-2543(-)